MKLGKFLNKICQDSNIIIGIAGVSTNMFTGIVKYVPYIYYNEKVFYISYNTSLDRYEVEVE